MERTGKRRPKSGCVGSVTSTSSGSSEDGLWNRAPWEALVRSSQPRYPDESRGATRFRQARAQADPGLSPGRGHGERTGQPERGGHTPRWPAVALVVEPAPGRPGPGAGASRSPVLPIRGRLQHLCADGACGPAGDGERDTLSDEASPAEGERVEECGGSTQGPEVSGIPLHLGQEREARHCAEGSAPVQGASPGADGSQPREECGRCREAPDQLPQWLGGLFRLLPDPSVLEELDGWIRRRLRMLLWQQWQTWRNRKRMLVFLGVPERRAAEAAACSRGPWAMATHPALQEAMGLKFFDHLGLLQLRSMMRT